MTTSDEGAKKEPYRYRVSYAIDWKAEPGESPECPGVTADVLHDSRRGGADAVFLASILYPPDGSLSVQYRSLDGATNEELRTSEVFKLAVVILLGLSDRDDLSMGQRTFCEVVRQMLMGAEAEVEGQPS